MARERSGPEERKLFHTGRIDAERNGVRRFWLVACWVAAELKHLARRDPAKAHATGLHLAKQMRTIAVDLNQQHLDELKARKGVSRAV